MPPGLSRRTSRPVTKDLFDRRLRAIRRDRAASIGPEMFLLDRAFEDCLDRLRDIPRSFDHALLVGCPSPAWPALLGQFAARVDVVDPGQAFAARAGGIQVEEDRFDFGAERYDLCLAVGTLDTVNDLPLAFQLLNRALKPDSPLIGAIAGGNSLPALRASLIDAGRSVGRNDTVITGSRFTLIRWRAVLGVSAGWLPAPTRGSSRIRLPACSLQPVSGCRSSISTGWRCDTRASTNLSGT